MGCEDAVAYLCKAVAFVKIFVNELDWFDQITRQQDLQFLKSASAYSAAQAHDAAFAGTRLLGDLGDGHSDDVLCVFFEIGRDPLGRWRKILTQLPQSD